MLKAPVFPFSWQFLETNLRSFSFLTESISASRNLPVPIQEKCSLTLCYFYMDKTICIIPNCGKMSRHLIRYHIWSYMHGKGWRRDYGNLFDVRYIITFSKNDNTKCSSCIPCVWYTLYMHVFRRCPFPYVMYLMFPYIMNVCSHTQCMHAIQY